MTVPVVFDRIIELGLALGWRSIKDLPGCVEHQIDEQWWFAINPHRDPEKCSKRIDVSPYSAYVEFNGWPAGMFNARGGMMAAGRIANEEMLIAAIDAAIKRISDASQ